ncbi:MAG: response regulator [Pyrinomonadaceae bacterium]|nr:response regulator [Sphingobacteriaceae bacterium]
MPPKPIKVAVVDDDQIYQFIMQRTLAKIDSASKILNFSNCEDFLIFLKRNAQNPDYLPDLVLLDLNTPFMNGWEFLEAYNTLKASLSKKIDVYMVSSSVDPYDMEEATNQENLQGFLTKPLNPEQLQEMVYSAAVHKS